MNGNDISFSVGVPPGSDDDTIEKLVAGRGGLWVLEGADKYAWTHTQAPREYRHQGLRMEHTHTHRYTNSCDSPPFIDLQHLKSGHCCHKGFYFSCAGKACSELSQNVKYFNSRTMPWEMTRVEEKKQTNRKTVWSYAKLDVCLYQSMFYVSGTCAIISGTYAASFTFEMNRKVIFIYKISHKKK